MQAQIERRSHAQRVPMDREVVEVSFVEYGESAPADAVNIAEGGLSLRASILPDVGTEMRCAFPLPGGSSVEAECEVVWAQHSGPYAGEFGLRFVDLDREAEARIREYVAAQASGRHARGDWSDSAASGEALDDSDPGHAARVDDGYEPEVALAEESLAPEPAHSAIPERLKLHIDGVGSPVVAEIAHASHEALVVEQELAFLKRGVGIAAVEGGPKGRLASVDLRMEGDTPRLVLTVLFGDESAKAESATPQTSASDAVAAPAEAALEVSRLEDEGSAIDALSPLDTLPDPISAPVQAPAREAAKVVRAAQAPATAHLKGRGEQEALEAQEAHAEAEQEAEQDAERDLRAASATERQHVKVIRHARALDDHAAPAGPAERERHEHQAAQLAGALGQDLDQDLDQDHDQDFGVDQDSPLHRLSSSLRERGERASERVRPLMRSAKRVAASGARGLGPKAKALWARLLVLFSALRSHAGPALSSLLHRSRDTVTRLRGGAPAARSTTKARPKRRQQSRMSQVGARPSAESVRATQLDPRAARRRTLLLSSIAFVLVATTVWALTPGDEAEAGGTSADADESSASGSSASASAAGAAPSSASNVVSPYVMPETSTPASSTQATAAAAAPTPSGPTPGPLAEPTYPTLGDTRPQDPGSVPAGSAYAEAEGESESPPVQEGRTFGADSVDNARTFEITMSQRVQTLRGRVEANGFTVDIPGALAMSGARTISRNLSSVARSHILNHGDHATLTVEFVAGRSPAYRVSAQGAGIKIEIER